MESYYASVQQQLGRNRILDLAYVGNHSVKLMNIGNFNQRNTNLGRGSDGLFIRPYPTIGDIIYRIWEDTGTTTVCRCVSSSRMSADSTLLNSFTYSRTFDNAAGNLENSFGNNPGPQDLYNTRADYGPSEYDKPLIDVLSVVYQLLFGAGHRWHPHNSLVNGVIGGWQTSVINTIRSGQTFTPIYSPARADTVSGISSSTTVP